MDFGFSADEQQFRREIREFLDKAWPPEVRAARRQGRVLTPARRAAVRRFRQAVAERGWYALGWPAEYGGTPKFTPMERFILSDECSRIEAPLSLYAVNIMGPLIIKYGSPWMKEELLPLIRAGELDFSLGFTEPETGSDLANLQTRAVRDGDEYVINGQKVFSRPLEGNIIYLAVRTDPDAPLREGISLLFVEHDRPGFTGTGGPGERGMAASFYDDVRVPADHLLGEENKGWNYVREALDLDRTSGIPYGHLPLLLDELFAFVQSASLNGRPLKDDPWVRDRLAQFFIEMEAGAVFQAMTASKLSAGLKLRVESSVQKIYLTELERRIAEFGMEIAGPAATVTWESKRAPLGGWINSTLESNVGITIAGGSNEIQRNIIAFQGLRLPRDY